LLKKVTFLFGNYDGIPYICVVILTKINMSKLLNWQELSRLLSGSKGSVRRDRIPKKYREKVLILTSFVEKWEDFIKGNDEGFES